MTCTLKFRFLKPRPKTAPQLYCLMSLQIFQLFAASGRRFYRRFSLPLLIAASGCRLAGRNTLWYINSGFRRNQMAGKSPAPIHLALSKKNTQKNTELFPSVTGYSLFTAHSSLPTATTVSGQSAVSSCQFGRLYQKYSLNQMLKRHHQFPPPDYQPNTAGPGSAPLSFIRWPPDGWRIEKTSTIRLSGFLSSVLRYPYAICLRKTQGKFCRAARGRASGRLRPRAAFARIRFQSL